MPPRSPVEISATTTPITDADAAEPERRHHRRHGGGEPQVPQRLRPRGGVAVHQLDRRRRRRLEAPQGADDDREEGEERPRIDTASHRGTLPPEEVDPPAPAHHERGEGDQRDGLRHDEVRAADRGATTPKRAITHRQRRRRRRAPSANPTRASRNEYQAPREHDQPDRRVRRAALGVEQPPPHLPHVRHRRVAGSRQDAPAEHLAAGLRAERLVELPQRGHARARATTKSDDLAHRLVVVRSLASGIGSSLLGQRLLGRCAGMTCSP